MFDLQLLIAETRWYTNCFGKFELRSVMTLIVIKSFAVKRDVRFLN